MKQIKQAIYLFTAVLFIAIFAQITIDVPVNDSQIPISGQTFAVLLVGFLLQRKWGTIALLCYLFIGIIGLPVFADGESGWAVIEGGSGGFLLGFVVGAFAVGWLSELGWGMSIFKTLLAMAIGTLIIMAFGVARLTQLYDFEKAMEWGFYPFVPGAIVKIFLGGVVALFCTRS